MSEFADDPRYREFFREHRELMRELDALRAQWRRLGAPIADRLRPGLHPDVSQAMAAEHGLTLTPDLLVWWSWADGVEAPDDNRLRQVGPGGFELLSLREALDARARNLRIHQPAPNLGEIYWRDSWLPFAIDNGVYRLYVDLDRRREWPHESPVRIVTREWDDFDVDRTGSLHELVGLWRWALAHDRFRWQDDCWREDREAVELPETLVWLV